jgi:hypothetical protein
MTVVASSVFRCVQFPHQGKIVTIDQLDFCTPDARIPATNNIPFLGDHPVTYESVGVGLLKDSSLMGTFPTPLPPTAHHIAAVNMISTMPYQSLESSDPWIVPSPLEFDVLSDTMPLSPAEAAYVAIQSASPSSNTSHSLAPDTYSVPSWLDSLSSVVDYISHIFPSDESIMEMLSIDDLPWDDNHHRSSFLPPLEEITKTYDLSSPPMLPMLHNLLSSHKILSLRGTWVTSLLQSRLTFQSKKVSWKTLTLVLIAHPTKWFLTPLCSRNSAMSSHGATRKCQGSTLQSSYTKSKLTLTQNRFDKTSPGSSQENRSYKGRS